jgi:hypothetical protein
MPTFMSLLSILDDKVSLKIIKQFNSSAVDSFDKNIWITSYPGSLWHHCSPWTDSRTFLTEMVFIVLQKSIAF